jgi:hypothetical protein
MFTQKEIALALSQARPFCTKCAEFRALLTEHELPLSVDLDKLKDAIRAQLFARLLAVDKGLKMRFEMLRTEEAQHKLVTETIDLAGYTIIDEMSRRIQELQSFWGSVRFRWGAHWLSPEKDGVTLAFLASSYGLDPAAWINSQAYDWTGKAHVLEYFRTLGQQLTQQRALQRVKDASATLQGVTSAWLAGFFTQDSNQGEIEPEEHPIHYLAGQLQSQGKLAGFPGNLK